MGFRTEPEAHLHSGSGLTAVDYSTFASRALDWTDRHLDLFELFDGDRAFEIKRGQRVGELAILVHAMYDVHSERTSPNSIEW